MRKIQEFPAFELRTIREVGVFGQGVVLPAAGVVNYFAPPYAGRAIEVEKRAAPRPRAMLDHEVAVEENGFDVGQKRIVAVQIRPARLHHPDFLAALGIQEIRNRAPQEIRFRNEVGVKDRHEFALSGSQPVLQRSGLVTLTICAMDVRNGHALGGVALRARASHFLRLIGGIIQHLHVEQFPRIVKPRDRFGKPLDYITFIENRQLHCHPRPPFDWRRRRRDIFGIQEIVVDQPVAMQPVHREHQ